MNIASAKWIWSRSDQPNTYCLARGRFALSSPAAGGKICIFADSRYQLWVNGEYIGQGPTPFRRPHMYVDTYDITSRLRKGENVIAVLGNYHGVPHCTYTVGKPGILVSAEIEDRSGEVRRILTDESWKVCTSLAHIREVPRRNGATSWMECYDARREPTGWRDPDFNDSGWEAAQAFQSEGLVFLPRVVPYLREYPASQGTVLDMWVAEHAAPALDELTAVLDREPLKPLDSLQEFPLVIAESQDGFALAVDFHQELAGQVELDVESPDGVVLDVCPAENLQSGRPWCLRKGTQYAKRYITRSGRQCWRAFGYDGLRYVHVVVRGPHPKLTLHRVGVWRRETSLPLRASFRCDDVRVNRIWDITCHTMRIGAQDVHVDCPTREQTSAWGDHIWSGLWEIYLTGDRSHLRHLMLAMEQVQRPDGQLPCYAFSGVDLSLYDFSLIAVIGIGLYLRHTGDTELVRRLLPTGDRVLDWYRGEIGPSGLVELDGQKAWDQRIGQLFIDHPGLQTHSHSYPPIDRKGVSAGLNFFFLMALDSLADVRDALGDKQAAEELRNEAGSLRAAADRWFFDEDKALYVDAVDSGRASRHISQQTNALAVLSGTCKGERAGRVLRRILEPDPSLCLCETYFWTYLSAALCRAGMHREMWENMVLRWNEMAEKGATSWWETFQGDHLDSLCHIWSSVPAYVIPAEILGVKPAEPGFEKISIRPRFDLLRRAEGIVPIRDGRIAVRWSESASGEVCLEIENQTPFPASVEAPPGWKAKDGLDTTMKPIEPHSPSRKAVYSTRK
jgi:alpha-L-rhamnosidase